MASGYDVGRCPRQKTKIALPHVILIWTFISHDKLSNMSMTLRTQRVLAEVFLVLDPGGSSGGWKFNAFE